MNKYYKYLKYVLNHKWYVFQECFKVGLIWRGVMHDMSKFRPSEFIPYARYFNGKYFTKEECIRSEKLNYVCRPSQDDIKRDFNIAWLKHIHRNKHHWQYWILREDDGETKVLEMPIKYVFEMISDWRGAGKAIHSKDETLEWYKKNKDKMLLSEEVRRCVEITLGFIN